MLDQTVSNEIIQIVKEEIRIYKEILLLSEEKRQVLIEGKAVELDRIIRTEQRLSAEVVGLERNREEKIQLAVEAGSILKEDIIVSMLAKKMDKKSGEELLTAGMELTKVLEELKIINDINGELIKQSLDYIEYTVNIMSNTNQATNLTYGKDFDNMRKMDGKKTFFDTKG